MKRIYLLSTIIGLLFISSCGNGWLDEMVPQTSAETEKSLFTLTEAEYALNGIYDLFRTYEYYGARYTYYADAKSEDMQARADSKRVGRYYLFTHNTVNAPSNFWSYPYKVIRNANNILEFLDEKYEGAQNDQWKNIKGQALTMRAMAHFDLVKVYGLPYTKDGGASLGVPVVLKKMSTDAKPARNTVAEVYKQIIDDLEDASTLIGKAKADFKLNWYATRQLLARAYLYKNDNSNAYTVASELITAAEANGYRLFTNAEYKNAWKAQTGTEYFFVIMNSADEISDSKEFVSYLMARSGYDDLILSSDYMDLINTDSKDIRKDVTSKYTHTKTDGKTCYYLLKYISPDYKVSNIPVLRISEAYLIAAEAAAKKNDPTNAAKYLNAIVTRANPAKSVTEDEATVERILIERRKELVGEGHRLFDAMRNNQTIERKGASHDSNLLTTETRKFDWNFGKILMPIPHSEISTNPNMVQNTGYSN